MPHFINPLNVPYHYQFVTDPRNLEAGMQINRESADPSIICYHGKYYIYNSMNLSVWVSEDLANWESYPLPDYLPLYDYAPDVRVINDWVYFSASRRGQNCDFYRTKDPVNGPYERFEGSFAFWDPNLFVDDDGRVYFYWGCANTTPLYGVEMDLETMQPKTEPVELLWGDPFNRGWERSGEGHSEPPATDEECTVKAEAMLKARGMDPANVDENTMRLIKGMFSNMPYIEGAWMTKHNGKYYLQYAFPGTQWNVYGDGVVVGDSPLGPFEVAQNNPYSYAPGSFLPGAGHGSTLETPDGKFWHTATGRISMHHMFERRVGLWPVGFDADGEMFCAQRYHDWPINTEGDDPWREPDWYLLSYGKTATASSSAEGHEPALATDENVQTWWKAATNEPGQWLAIDLGGVKEVHAVQINFADDQLNIPAPGEITSDMTGGRYIDPILYPTRWMLEGSADGENWEVLCDKSQVDTCLPHDVVWLEGGKALQQLRVTVYALPYGQEACISGLRVFGIGEGEKPAVPTCTVTRTGEMDFEVTVTAAEGAVGYNILWGHDPEKLYHSYLTYKTTQTVGALAKGQKCYVRVDAFNEAGITHGTTVVEV